MFLTWSARISSVWKRSYPFNDVADVAVRDSALVECCARGADRAAGIMPENHHERGLQHADPVLDAAQHLVAHHVARRAHHKQVTQALIENDLSG